MKDRTPRKPGRFLVNTDDGRQYYATLTLADNPEEDGDPLNKNTLLKDGTAALFGLGASALPDDVFRTAHEMIESKAVISAGSYIGTGLFGSSNPTSLTFDFEPKFLIVTKPERSVHTTNTLCYEFFVWAKGATLDYLPAGDAYGNGKRIYTLNGNTISWYVHTTADHNGQFNESGVTYHYVAIG